MPHCGESTGRRAQAAWVWTCLPYTPAIPLGAVRKLSHSLTSVKRDNEYTYLTGLLPRESNLIPSA